MLADAIGSGLAIGSIGLLTLALAQGPGWDWDGRVFGSFIAALGLGTAFVLRSLPHRAPVLELELFRTT